VLQTELTRTTGVNEPADASGTMPLQRSRSRHGFARLVDSVRYSRDGFVAAFRGEASFREEVMIGIPMIALAWAIAPGAWQAVAMTLSIVAVLVVELLNSAVEALADTISLESNPLIKSAKDMGSAAVMLSILAAGLIWTVALVWG
jgi:diacylglycerol kinase (ATP)